MHGLARLGLAGAVILAFAAPLHVGAQQAASPAAPQVAAPVIITVDVQQILRDSLVAKDVQAQMDQRTDRYTKEVSSQENDLQKTQDELEQERTKLAPDAFNTRMREFQQRYDTLDNRVQATRQGLQQSYNDAMTKVENTALQIIADIAAERKANLVVAKAAVLFEAQELDITQEVIKRLDEKLPKVDLAPPQIPPPPGAGSVSGSVPGSGAAGGGTTPALPPAQPLHN
jgi:outer membrane protein